MDKKLKAALGLLIAPTAVGLYVTLAVTWLCFLFFAARDAGYKDHWWVSLLLRAHQSSIDYRLQVRGPRPGSDKVGLLVVDEKAVATVGRWPWPREILAKAIDNAFKNGAAVLAFDMAFPEPTNNVAQTLYDKLHAEHILSPQAEQTLKAEAQSLDGDRALAQVFGKYADRIVAGSFYDESTAEEPGYRDYCNDLAYHLSPAAKLWDHEEVLLTPEDPHQQNPPRKITEILTKYLADKEAAIRARGIQPAGRPLDKREQVQLDQEVERQLEIACQNIFENNRDELSKIWRSDIKAKENTKDFKWDSYDDWVNDFKNQSFPNAILQAKGWTLDVPVIAEQTKNTGYFNANLDNDGTIRSSRLIVHTGRSYFPSLPLKTYLVATHQNAAVKMNINPATGRNEVVEFGLTDNDTGNIVGKIPTDGEGTMMINYYGPQKMFPHMSLADLLTDGDDAEIDVRRKHKDGRWVVETERVKKSQWLKDKILVVGATAIGIFDLRPTPFETTAYPGVETHANVISNLLTHNYFRSWEEERSKMPLLLLVLGIVLSVTLAQIGAIPGLTLTGLFFVAFWFIDKFYLFDHGIVVAIIWPLIMISGVFVTMTFYRYLTEERGKKELRQTFQKYVSPAIVEEILSDPKNIELGGRKQNVTLFFSDVRGFTTISEKLDPRALSDLLNSYLTPMTELVFKNRGTLDKYMGDAVMAFFGAPIHYRDHAKYACRCALQSVKKLFELQKEYERKGLPKIDIGIGLNSGEVSVGNMGSQTVRSYTVMGDAVNLASRLEGINKQYGTRIIISEFTFAQVKSDFVCREIDWVRVKGKALPVKIYELIEEGKAKGPTETLLNWFQEGYVKYHEKSWAAALEAFTKALNVKPDDEVSKVYLARCQEYLVEPPPDDWDGVFVMKTK